MLEGAVGRVLLQLDPETAHKWTLRLVRASDFLYPSVEADDARLSQRLFGIDFKNPIGAAAGLDKDAEIFSFLIRKHGFGFVEVGTVTPKPQPGNEGPRVFRLAGDGAIVNRFGFNSHGQDTVRARLEKQVGRNDIVGVNLGANKDSADRIDDYVLGIQTFAASTTYFTINVSSPNTPGLRTLQQAAALDELLARVMDARECAAESSPRRPILLKIAPDLTLADLDDVVGVARRHRIDGMIVSNTTISRPSGLRERELATKQGGLSGRPLFALSTRMLAEAYVRAEKAFPLIGAGGIDSGAAAFAKIKAGASLVQLYTGLIFRGIGLVGAIKADLLDFMRIGRLDSLSDAVGRDAAAITAEPWPT